jgi:membrane protein YqaA with SNARE-associated domain
MSNLPPANLSSQVADANLATTLAGIPWAKIFGWLNKAKFWIVALLKPFGAWGILGLSLVDSAAIPLPFLDPLIVSYGVAAPAKAILYCFMGALGSAIGSLLPYFIGRAGGELFLLKRINRTRYEELRDRFEKQEFLAIMLPAMCPPPMPVKLFELAAGVFEMRLISYFLAILTGKFVRFAIESTLVIIYGPAILENSLRFFHRHSNIGLSIIGALIFALLVYILRKVFDRKKGEPLPVEDTHLEVSPDDHL